MGEQENRRTEEEQGYIHGPPFYHWREHFSTAHHQPRLWLHAQLLSILIYEFYT